MRIRYDSSCLCAKVSLYTRQWDSHLSGLWFFFSPVIKQWRFFQDNFSSSLNCHVLLLPIRIGVSLTTAIVHELTLQWCSYYTALIRNNAYSWYWCNLRSTFKALHVCTNLAGWKFMKFVLARWDIAIAITSRINLWQKLMQLMYHHDRVMTMLM